MPGAHHLLCGKGPPERALLAALVADDYARCHPADMLAGLERRACSSKAARGLSANLLEVPASRSAAAPSDRLRRDAAA